jgi:hypothetical protein
LERSNSIKSTSFLDESSIEASRASSKKKRGSKRVSTTETSQMNAQGSLAEILGGKRPSAMNSSSRNGRSDSISSSISSSSTSRGHVSSQEADESFKQTPQADLNAMLKARLTEKPPTLRNPPGQAPEPALANAFSASLAAIRKNRLPSECGDTPAEVPVRNRNRDSQLSAEGKDLLHKAISGNFNEKTVKKSVTSSERKGLFDESSSSDEDVGKNGLFGAGSSMVKPNLTSSITSSSVASPTSQSTTKGKTPSTDSEGESDDGATSSYFKSKISPTQRNDIATNLPTPSAPSTLSVSFISYAVQSDGKKSHGVYTFVFTYGSLTHRFSYSYHELEAIHDRLSSELGSESLPKFPSKHWYRNNTKPENMQKRAMEFLSYFQFLISNPRLVKNNRFHFEFKMDNRFVSAISGHVPIGVPTSLPIEPLQITSPPGTDRSPQRVVTTPRPAQNASKSSALFGAAADSESDSDSSDSCGSVKTPEPLKEAPVVKLRQKDRADEASKSSASTRAKERAGQKSRSKDKEPPKTNSCVPVEPPSPLPKAVTGLPPRPNPFGGGRGDLLAAIRQGKQLRKVDEGECQTSASPLPPAGRGASKPSNTSPLPPPPLNQAGSINDAINNAMAARRIHVEYDEHSDEDSDDDWD